MLIEGSAGTAVIRARVAVVGSGPAGMALALALGRSGLEVVVIESGGLAADANVAALGAPASGSTSRLDLAYSGRRRLGGTTWSWGGRCVAYDAIDFEPRPGAEAPGWPVEQCAMLAEAEAAARFLGIGTADFDCPAPALGSQLLRSSFERWCAEPQLARVHVAELKASTNIRVHLGINCVGADIDAGGRAMALSALDRDGGQVRVEAEQFVLAGGGIESARLLLWFFEQLAPHAAPRWLGRGYMSHLQGQVAQIVVGPTDFAALDYRRNGDVCFTRPRLMLDAAVQRAEGLLNIGFYLDNMQIGDAGHGSAALSGLAMALATPGLGSMLAPEHVRRVLLGQSLDLMTGLGHAANVARAPWEIAAYATQVVRGRFGHPRRPLSIARNRQGRYALMFCAEQLARMESGVRLSSERDANGVPRIALESEANPFDVDSVLVAHDLLEKALARTGRAGLEYRVDREARAEIVRGSAGATYHEVGLARMGRDRMAGVVDADARVHGLANVHVAGSAVFPTSSHANPTFMIVCQALRLAGHLQRRMAVRPMQLSTGAATG